MVIFHADAFCYEYCSNLMTARLVPGLFFVLQSPSFVSLLLFNLFFQHVLVVLLVLLVTLQALNILLPEEYFSPQLAGFTTLCKLSELSGLCPITLPVLCRAFLSMVRGLETIGFMKNILVGIPTMLLVESLDPYLLALFAVRSEL